MTLKKHKIIIRYTTEETYTGLSTAYGEDDLLKAARRYWQEWWDHRYGPEPEVHAITIDGQTFTIEQIRSYKG